MSDPSEAPRRRRRQPAPPAPPAQGSVVKGAILVVVAVVIGLALLRDDSSTATKISVGAESPVTQPGDDGDPSSASSTSSTTVAVRAPSEVKVLVANGSDVNGAAGVQTNALKALGYVTANPGNAARVPATVVYFTTGYEGEAAALAAAIGAPATAVQALPTPAPVDDMALSNVLVVLGPDLAKAG